MLRPVWGYRTVRRLRTVGIVKVDETVARTLRSLCDRMQLRQSIELWQSTLIDSPMVVGCLKVVVLLPVALISNIPAAQLEAILAHELQHVRRHDYLANLIQAIAESVFFYHPAMWWISQRMRVEREHCCDDYVVQLLNNPVEYGRALLAIEERRQSIQSQLALSATGGSLLKRVQRLVDPAARSKGRGSLRLTLIDLLGSCALIAAFWMLLMTNTTIGDDNEQADRQANLQVPFRLADHGYLEDIRWVKNDGQLITVALQGGVDVRRWDVANRRLIGELKLLSDQHGRPVEQGSLKISPDGRRVFGVTDAYVGVWDSATGALLRQLAIPKIEWEYDTVSTLACSADGSIVVAGLGTHFSRLTMSYPGYGVVWNANTGEVISKFKQDRANQIVDVAMSADGKLFATISLNQTAAIWDTATGQPRFELSPEVSNWNSSDPALINNHVARGIALSPNGRQCAVVGTFGIKLFDTSSGKLQRTIAAPYRYGQADVIFADDGRRIMRVGATRAENKADSILVWSIETGELLTEIVCDANHACFSQDGTRVAAAEADFNEAVSVWPIGKSESVGPLLPDKSADRINRVEENTHLSGASAAELAKRWDIQWGDSNSRLQYGIALTTKERSFTPGQKITMVAFIRNQSEQEVGIDVTPDMFGNLPNVRAADASKSQGDVTLAKLNLAGRHAHYRETLGPGELFGPLYFSVGLGENPRPHEQYWTPYWPNPATGTYSITHRIDAKVAGHLIDDANDPAWQATPLKSGQIEVTLAAQQPAVEANAQDVQDDEAKKVAIPVKPQPWQSLPDSLNIMAVQFDEEDFLWSLSTREKLVVRKWNLKDDQMVQECTLETDKHANHYLTGELIITKDCKKALGILGHEIHVWDTSTGKRLSALQTSGMHINEMMRGLSVTADAKRAASGHIQFSGLASRDATASVWDLESGEVLRTVTHIGATMIQSTALSADGRYLATGGQDQGFCIWDLETGALKYQNLNENKGCSIPMARLHSRVQAKC